MIIVVGIADRRRARPVHRADREDDRDAAAGVAVQRGRRRRGRPDRDRRLHPARNAGSAVRIDEHIFIVLDIIIGSITFTGSIIAVGQAPGPDRRASRSVPGGQLVTLALAAVTVVGARSSCS